MNNTAEKAVAVGALGVAGALAVGASQVHGEAGYAGVGPAFIPWAVSAAVAVCALWLLYHASTGGFRDLEREPDAGPPSWMGMAWVSAGLLLNAALITTVGFILSCSLLFVLAARGFRLSMGATSQSPSRWVTDALLGMVLSAPVFWLFTQALGLNLPGLTQTGWF